MKPEHRMGDFGELPGDVHNEIIKNALASSDTVEEAIRAIKVANVLRGARYDNLENFTKIVHLLANKFSKPTAEVADKFDTSIAKKYNELGNKLISNISKIASVPRSEHASMLQIIQIIKDGGDANYSSDLKIENYGLQAAGLPDVMLVRVNPLNQAELLKEANPPLYEKITEMLRNAGAK